MGPRGRDIGGSPRVRRRTPLFHLVLSAMALSIPTATSGVLLSGCLDCVKDGDVFDVTSGLCFATNQAILLPATSRTVKDDFRLCPGYGAMAILMDCVQCLTDGNQYVVGVNGTNSNTCVVTVTSSIDASKLGKRVVSSVSQCNNYNLADEFKEHKTCSDCTLNGKRWYLDTTNLYGGMCFGQGEDPGKLSGQGGVALTPMQCEAAPCTLCLGGRWCYSNKNVTLGTCTEPTVDCTTMGLTVLTGSDLNQLQQPKTCKAQSELRSVANGGGDCGKCLTLPGASWCDASASADTTSYCYYKGDYTLGCREKDNTVVAAASSCPAPSSGGDVGGALSPKSAVKWDMCWDTRQYRCVLVGYVMPAAIVVLIILLALFIGCTCGACGTTGPSVTVVVDKAAAASPTVIKGSDDEQDDAFRRAQISDV